MEKRSNLKTLADDITVGIRYATKNILTFLLGMIGILLVTAVFVVIFMIVFVFGLMLFMGGPLGMISFFESFGTNFLGPEGLTTMSLTLLVMLPFLSPLFVAIGVLFGMGREIVESEGANAEGVFTWYRRKFVPLAMGGIIVFLVVIGPIFLGVITLFNMGGVTDNLTNAFLATVAVLWVTISSGSLTMLFPSIIDGQSALEALKTTLRMSYSYFDRIFSVWLGYIGILILPFVPAIFLTPLFTAESMFSGISIAFMSIMGIWALVDILVIVPAISISLSRVYLILSAIEPTQAEDDHPGISFVGGI
ncbi:MAG: hypothetical protein RTU30_06420 [Candidatus Thorarchaeota archaeon]